MSRKAFYNFVDQWVRGWRSLAYSQGRRLNEDLLSFLIEHRVKSITYKEELSLTGVTLTFRDKEYLYLSQPYKGQKFVSIVDVERNKVIFEATSRTPTVEEDFFKGNRDLYIPENHMFGLPAVNFVPFLDDMTKRYIKESGI